MPRKTTRTWWKVAGPAAVVLVGVAALASNATIESALSASPGSLAWGPTLFRVLLAVHGFALLAAFLIARRPAPAENASSTAVPAAERHLGRWLVLGALTAVALVLRLWRLNSCLWLDEILTLVDYVRPPLGSIFTSFGTQNQHMLYSILGHVSVRWFGESAWAVRLPAVLFGVGSIWALFFFGRRVVGATEALLACALMTLSYHHIWFSQNARGYTGLLFFTTLGTWFFLEALDSNEWSWWLGYALASCLGMWVHISMLFVVGAQAMVFLGVVAQRLWLTSARDRSFQAASLLKPAAAWALAGSLTLQLYALSLPQFFSGALNEGNLKSEWTNPLWVLRETVKALQIGWSGSAVVLCGGLLLVVGWLRILRRDWRAAVLMVAPGVLGGATMLVLSHNLWPRFFFFSIGFALLIVMHGAMAAPGVLFSVVKGLRSRDVLARGLGFAVAALMIVASALTVPRYYAIPKQDFTGARDFIESNRQPGDAIVAVGLAAKAYDMYYAPEWSFPKGPDDIQALLREHGRVWLVYTIPLQLQSFDTPMWGEIDRNFKVVKVFQGTLSGGDVTVCRAQGLRSLSGGSSNGDSFAELSQRTGLRTAQPSPAKKDRVHE